MDFVAHVYYNKYKLIDSVDIKDVQSEEQARRVAEEKSRELISQTVLELLGRPYKISSGFFILSKVVGKESIVL